MRQIILASQSPRRQELFAKMGLPFTVVPSNFIERLDDERNVAQVAEELGLGKAIEVAKRYPEAVVVGSDTIVTFEDKQLGKPQNSNKAKTTLIRLNGKTNIVTASIAVVCLADHIQLVGSTSTKVTLKRLSEELIDSYVASGDPLDKAGSYGIQDIDGRLISKIDGDYDAVLGLDTKLLAELLNKAGIKVKK